MRSPGNNDLAQTDLQVTAIDIQFGLCNVDAGLKSMKECFVIFYSADLTPPTYGDEIKLINK